MAHPAEKPNPKRIGKKKNFQRINSVKMCKVSDGRRAHNCKHCGSSHRFRVCPFCGKQ